MSASSDTDTGGDTDYCQYPDTAGAGRYWYQGGQDRKVSGEQELSDVTFLGKTFRV